MSLILLQIPREHVSGRATARRIPPLCSSLLPPFVLPQIQNQIQAKSSKSTFCSINQKICSRHDAWSGHMSSLTCARRDKLLLIQLEDAAVGNGTMATVEDTFNMSRHHTYPTARLLLIHSHSTCNRSPHLPCMNDASIHLCISNSRCDLSHRLLPAQPFLGIPNASIIIANSSPHSVA